MKPDDIWVSRDKPDYKYFEGYPCGMCSLMQQCRNCTDPTSAAVQKRLDFLNTLYVVESSPVTFRYVEKNGVCKHEWRTDGMHSNVFCGKCFASR